MKTTRPALRYGCLILASMALAISPVLAQTPEPAGATTAPTVISSVAITQAPERAAVRVEGEGKLEVRAARMQNPERLVLDFAGARLQVDKTSIPGISAPVRGVRLGQYRPDIARIVVDLTSAAPYQISRDGAAVIVSFDAQPMSPTRSSTEKNGRPEFHYATASPRTTAARSAKPLQISAPRFVLPSELTQPSVLLASFGGASQPARPEGSAQQAAQQAVQQANSAATTLATQTAPVTPSGKYSGEPISVNLKDVDLRDFFRLIHEISGLNVVLDPAVKGTLTIVLDEVPWDQALDIVLQNNGLDKQLNGNVLRIATRDTLKQRSRDASRPREGPSRRYRAGYRHAGTQLFEGFLAPKDTLKKFLSSRGDILSDDRSNQLIIRDIPQVIPVVDNLIHQLDRKSQQVEIEARVVAASRSFAQDIGTELGFAGTTTGGRSLFSGSPAVGGSGVTTGTGIPASPITIGSTSGSGNGITTRSSAEHQLPRGSADERLRVLSIRSPNFAIDFLHHRGGGQRRRQAAFKAPRRHAEQRKGYG